ncbi:MAG: hypothetical protein ACOWWR_18550 [Eubacteriales bacterium]
MKKILTLLLTILLLNILVAYAVDITMGYSAIVRSDEVVAFRTYVFKNFTANGTGTIDTIKVYAHSDIDGLEVASFYESGGTLSTRDYETIGDISSGYSSHSVSIDIQEGDYIGFHAINGYWENDSVITATAWGSNVDKIPCSNDSFSNYVNCKISFYAEGTVEGGITWNTAEISKWNEAEISKWNGVE